MSDKTYWVAFDWNAIGGWSAKENTLQVRATYSAHSDDGVHIGIRTYNRPAIVERVLVGGVLYEDFLKNRFWFLDKEYFCSNGPFPADLTDHITDLLTIREGGFEEEHVYTQKELQNYKVPIKSWYYKVKQEFHPRYFPLYLVEEDLLKFYTSNNLFGRLNPLKR